MARVKIADVAAQNKKIESNLKNTQIALATVTLWVMVLSIHIFFM